MKSKLPSGYQRDPQIRTNWGYWDGVAARERGCRLPAWAHCAVYRAKHPFDQKYGEGFWIGFYNETAPKGAMG